MPGQELTASRSETPKTITPFVIRDAQPPPRVRRPGFTASAWEQRLGEIRAQLDDVHAKLACAQRQLDATHEDRDHPRRALAAVRRARTQWLRAHRELDGLAKAGPQRPLPALAALGRDRGLLALGGELTEVSRRHTEVLVLLASHPEGMTTEELAVALYGDTGRPAAVRTALCRLRKGLPGWIDGTADRITVNIDADFLIVQRLLRAGRAREAAERYAAALLPRSEAPGIVEVRDELDAWVRSAVMIAGDPEALWAWLESASGADDLAAWKRFLSDLDPADPRRPLAVSRLARLRGALVIVSR
jgi:hypothetical protein